MAWGTACRTCGGLLIGAAATGQRPLPTTLQADVARYYTVDVEYHSGSNVNPNPRTLQPALIARRVVDVIVSDCTMTGTSALQLAKKTITADATLVVRCTTACDTDTTPVFIDATGAYLFTSAICRAATHAGLTVTTPFKLTLSAGGNLPRTFTGGVQRWQVLLDPMDQCSNGAMPLQFLGQKRCTCSHVPCSVDQRGHHI